MSFFSRAVDNFFEKRARANGSALDWGREVEESTKPTAAGIPVGPDTARTLIAVWACQSLIADGVASLPVAVYREDASGRKKPVKSPAWLKQPNPFETPFSFWHRIMTSLLGEDGNAYIYVMRSDRGAVASLWVLDPQRCDVDEHGPTPIITYDGIPHGPDEIIHIPAFTIPGQRKGVSIIDSARESIALGLAAEEYGARFFSQGTTMSGVIEHPGKATPGEVAIIAKMMKRNHSGVRNSHAIGVLSGGATFKPISVNPDQAQFLETRQFQSIQIAALYRVPFHLIDPSVQSTWGAGVEEQNKQFADYTLVPWITKLEQAISRLLPGNQVLKFNVDARLRAKTIDRYQAFQLAVTNGFMSLDEVRAQEDLDPIPNGHGRKHWMPANIVELGKEPEPEPQSGAPPDPGGSGDEDPKAEARHLPGKHDQGSHGRGGRGQLDGWTVLDRERQLADAAASTWDWINSPEGAELRAAHTREQLEDMVRQQAEMMVPPNPTIKLVKGKFTISYAADTSSTEEDRKLIARRLEELDGKAPVKGPVNVSIVTQHMMADPETRGMTQRGTGRIFLSELLFQPGAQKDDPGFMPSYGTAGVLNYTLTHEWGHAIDHASDADSIEAAGAAPLDGTSDYSVLGGWREAYAEAFAEWDLTGGETANPMVRWYAEHFGWQP